MNLGVVGHAREKFTRETREQAFEAIRAACLRHGATRIISGRSPMGGIDWWAEDIAGELGLPATIHAPRRESWDGDGRPASNPYTRGSTTMIWHSGFKARNEWIAAESSLVLVVVVRELPAGFAGQKFGRCYHCEKHENPPEPHVKSGACWTAWKCRRQEWAIL
jgi:hypothetical protein